MSLSKSPDNSVSVPLFLCEHFGMPHNSTFYLDSEMSNTSPYIEFQVQILEDTVFQVVKRSWNYNRSPVFLEYYHNYTLELKDVLTTQVILANLTRLGFEMTERKRNFLEDALHAFCRCNVTYEPTNSSFLMKFRQPSFPFEIIDSHSLNIFHAMIQLSGRVLQKQDFRYMVANNGNHSEWESKLSSKFIRGSAKRISGLILWIILVFLIVFNVALQFLTRDLEEVLDDAVRSVLDIPGGCKILSSKNVKARIVTERLSVENNTDDTNGENAQVSVIRLRRRD